jgi:outer membrane immunogenic protein
MRSTVLSLATFAAFVANAQAADLPIKTSEPSLLQTAFNWTGPYVGAHVGYGWGRTTVHDIDDLGLCQGSCPGQVFRYNFGGALAGVQAGYNWQSGMWVYGAEADISWSGISKSFVSAESGSDATRFETHVRWFGTGRVRAGITSGPALFYATGGFAYADVANSFLSATSPQFFNASVSGVKWGWTLGGGVEYAFNRGWSARAE